MSEDLRELIGYTDEWAVRPGDEIAVMVSTSAAEYEADLVRLRHGDDRQQAPGLKEMVVTDVPVTRHTGRRQFAATGSFAHVADAPAFRGLSSVTVMAWIWPTTPGDGNDQGIVSCLAPDGSRGWALFVDASGQVAVRIGSPTGGIGLSSGRPLLRRHWYLVCATFDGTTRVLRLYQLPQPGSLRDYENAVSVCEPSDAIAPGSSSVVIGALSARPDRVRRTRGSGHYNGKMDEPVVLAEAVSEATVTAWHSRAESLPPSRSLAVVAAWDLGHDPSSPAVKDRGPHGLDARLVNLPMRAVTGHTWSGRHHDFRTRPEEYTAIHFHADDLEDAEWSPDFTLRLPDGLRSGTYAIRLRGGGMVDRIPLFVRPPAGTATARVAVVLPTLTYLAYGNSRVVFNNTEFRESGLIARNVVPDPRDYWLRERRDLGMSLYDVHADGSGSCYASRRRPLVGLRPDFVNWMTGAPRHFGADLYIIDWLEEIGVTYDVICDEDVHSEGQHLLDRYRVVITGTHPEYCTEAMLDALSGYLNDGGRLMYLGGNGFYWATSIDPKRPHVIEVRRGVAGTRPWDSEPGEFHHSTTGEPGGLWRHRGRPPNQLVGVGFCAQTWTDAPTGYTVEPEALDHQTRWIFEGIDVSKPIGAFGLCMDSAVGDEIDRTAEHMGTPPRAMVLATSVPVNGGTSPAIEDSRFSLATHDRRASSSVAATSALTPTPRSGAVFSAASMNWAPSLSHDRYNNNIAHLTKNVLERWRMT